MPPHIQHEKKIMRKRRCAIFAHRWDVLVRSSLTWIGVNLLYILQSPPSFLRFLVYSHFSLLMSLPVAKGCRLNPCGWWVVGVPWRAAVCRPSPGGTVTQNASSVRGRQITTTLLPLLPRQARGVAAHRGDWKRRGERRVVTTCSNTSGEQEGSWEDEGVRS